MKFVPRLRILYPVKVYQILSGATTCICTQPGPISMAVGAKSLGVGTEKSTACVQIRGAGQRTLLLSLLTAAILGGTILYHHSHTSWRSSRRLIKDPTRYMPQVNRSRNTITRNRAERSSGCLVTGANWDSILQNTDRVPTPSYNITERSIQAFQAVSINYPEYSCCECMLTRCIRLCNPTCGRPPTVNTSRLIWC